MACWTSKYLRLALQKCATATIAHRSWVHITLAKCDCGIPHISIPSLGIQDTICTVASPKFELLDNQIFTKPAKHCVVIKAMKVMQWQGDACQSLRVFLMC
jgi:hypothetical protein